MRITLYTAAMPPHQAPVLLLHKLDELRTREAVTIDIPREQGKANSGEKIATMSEMARTLIRCRMRKELKIDFLEPTSDLHMARLRLRLRK